MLSNVGPRFRIGVIVGAAQGAQRGRGDDTNPRKLGLENFINPTYPGLETVDELSHLLFQTVSELNELGHNIEGEPIPLGYDKQSEPIRAKFMWTLNIVKNDKH